MPAEYTTEGKLKPAKSDGAGGFVSALEVPVDPGAIDWASRLARTGTGTPDASFDPETDITYVGAFRIPYFTGDDTSTTIKNAVAFKSPEAGGRNGPYGSLFIGGDGGGPSFPGGYVAEVQIPDYSNTLNVSDYTQLPGTTVLQNFVSVLEKAPIQDTDPNAPVRIPGAMQFIGDTLYMSFYAYYEANGINESNVLVCNDAKDMANSSYIGLLSRDGMDHGSKYAMEIPTEHRSKFGGDTHFCGVWASHSIIGRSSFGPALYSWTPANIQPGDTSVPATQHSFYGSADGEQIEFWSYNGEELINHYETELGLPSETHSNLNSYLETDPSTRISDPLELPLPDASLHPGSGHDTQIECAFIPPGSNTVVFIGRVEGSRFGSVYNARSWEKGTDQGERGGWHPASVSDKDNTIWTINLNDVANAASPHDPAIIQQGIFDGNRWTEATSSGIRGVIDSGAFDPSTGLLYVVHGGVRWSDFVDQKVISVYQVGGGN